MEFFGKGNKKPDEKPQEKPQAEVSKVEYSTVVCPTCKTIKQVKKGTRVACDKCNRDMIEVKADAGKKE